MATGDTNDFAARLRAVLPTRWFADDTPVLTAVLQGLGSGWAALYAQLSFVQLQTRIATATGAFLDLAASDYLSGFRRRLNEPDPSYAARIQKEIIRPCNTRPAIVLVMKDLTGLPPLRVFRPSYVADTGAYDTPTMAYDTAGAWGDYAFPFQALVQVQRGTAPGSGTPVVYAGPLGGYDTPPGAYDIGSMQWGAGENAQGAVTDADIYAAVARVTPTGHINWVAISN